MFGLRDERQMEHMLKDRMVDEGMIYFRDCFFFPNFSDGTFTPDFVVSTCPRL